MDEFSLIYKYFSQWRARHPPVLGVGDDAALLAVPAGMELAVSADTLVAGVHFPLDTPPEHVGYKALAVNLSDLAAMGAQPAWFTLCLTLAEAKPAWLEAFSHGMRELAEDAGIALVGGDMTRGPLSITVQVLGWVPAGQALRRSGARPGDGIWVTGTVGGAGLGLRLWPEVRPNHPATPNAAITRLLRPIPRLAEGMALRGHASAAIDVSDGLAADLGHILDASRVGAIIDLASLPLDPALRQLPLATAWELALTAGDDYELCFTAPGTLASPETLEFATRIGVITAEPTRIFRTPDGGLWQAPAHTGWQHFK